MVGEKYQVFISSTYEDLKDERDEVVRAVLEMGHIPVGMEMFSAADEEQWKIITRHIDESDYYVCIVAHRYGSVTPENISYTRKEYEYAMNQGVPVLGFIIDPAAPWPADRVDKTEPEKTRLEAFKDKVREKPVGAGWTSADDLHAKVSIALMKAFTGSPRPGWVRGGQGAGPEVVGELSRLSAENARLRDALAAATTKAASEAQDEVRRTIATLEGNQRELHIKYDEPNPEWEDLPERSLAYLFRLLAPDMHVELQTKYACSFVAYNLNPDDTRDPLYIPSNVMRAIFSEFRALGLVEPSTKRHPVSDSEEYWSLSEFGVEVLNFLNREKLRAFDPDPMPAPEEETAPPKKAAPANTATKKK